jgi:hypothetical protein
VQVNKTRVTEYEEGFNKIRAATGIASIEDLVDAFTKNEVSFVDHLCRRCTCFNVRCNVPWGSAGREFLPVQLCC